MIVIDTNIIGALMKAETAPRISAWLDRQEPSTLWTTTITIAEMRYGTERMPEGKKRSLVEQFNADVMGTFFPPERVLPFDARAAASYGRLVADAEGRGRPVRNFADAAIAAIASAKGFSVASFDRGPFESLAVPLIVPGEDR